MKRREIEVYGAGRRLPTRRVNWSGLLLVAMIVGTLAGVVWA